MKKTKILLPLVGLSALVSAMIPLVGCSCGNQDDPDPTEKVTITFEASEGGSLVGETSIEVDKGIKWSEVTKPTPSPSENYDFNCWFNGENVMLDNEEINSNITVTASFVSHYLCITDNVEPAGKGSKVKITNVEKNDLQLQYSEDGENWDTWDESGEEGKDETVTLDIKDGKKLYIRNTKNVWCHKTTQDEIPSIIIQDEEGKTSDFVSTTDVSGNILSLINWNEENVENIIFPMLFTGAVANDGINIKNAENLILPFKTLQPMEYAYMFYGCTGLETAPALPAETLAEDCYANMFQGCSSLGTAPKLLATELATGCCYEMFRDCTSLKIAPELNATTLAEGCYDGMFRGCESLTQAPALNASTLVQACYQNMFRGCSSLTQAPTLNASTLAESCYNSMFTYCTKLTTAPALPAAILVTNCYYNMFASCTSLTVNEKDTENPGDADHLIFQAPTDTSILTAQNMFLNTGGTRSSGDTPIASRWYYWAE